MFYVGNDAKPKVEKKQPKRKGIMSIFMGSEERKGMIENATDFIQNLIKVPVAANSRQEKLLEDIVSRLENLNDTRKTAAGQNTMAGVTVAEATNVEGATTVAGNQTEKTTIMLSQTAAGAASMGGGNEETTNEDQAAAAASAIPRNELYNPHWIEQKVLGKNDVYYLNTKEITFWQGLIDKYLHPLNKDEGEEKRVSKDLKELRNNSCFAFFMLNALWIVMQFQFEYVSVAFPKMQIPIGALYNRPDQKVQILGLIFLILFTFVLLLQFMSMLFHRWGTVIEILASTRIFSKHHKYRDTKLTIQEAVDLIKEMELEKQDLNNNNSNQEDGMLEPLSALNHMGETQDDESGSMGETYVPDPDYDQVKHN